ncbi:MAG TPA: CBS domain-containing protein [Gammaproteobacteria bacterium]|nr:CBS domain-containing protein [Gammaproteobacteria bacterium]
MISVGKLLEGKGGEVWHVSPEDTVFDAIKYMDNKHVGALAVVHENELVGILSERDYARKVILKDRASKETLVKEIMTDKVIHTFPEQPVSECLVIINEQRIRHLPVLDNGKLVGMISVGDVVKEIIKEQQYTIQQLENHLSWAESY